MPSRPTLPLSLQVEMVATKKYPAQTGSFEDRLAPILPEPKRGHGGGVLGNKAPKPPKPTKAPKAPKVLNSGGDLLGRFKNAGKE